MKELNGCPFCGGSPAIETIRNNSIIEVSVVCQSCRASVGGYIYVDDKKQYSEDFVRNCAVDIWNKRTQEPRKESNIEWALNKIKKGDFCFNVCQLANYIKNKKPCSECNECEFQDEKNAIDYLLAIHED